MIPGQLISPGQLTDPGVNFASVHGLTPATVSMSFSLPRGNFERRVIRCTTPGNPPCRGNFSPCTPLSNTPAGRRFFGGFLVGGSSVGRGTAKLGGPV